MVGRVCGTVVGGRVWVSGTVVRYVVGGAVVVVVGTEPHGRGPPCTAQAAASNAQQKSPPQSRFAHMVGVLLGHWRMPPLSAQHVAPLMNV